MVLHMSDESRLFGPRLMAYVDAQLEDRADSATAFAVQQVGISASQFGRWRSGDVLPRLDVITRLAEALGRPVLEVLAHAVGAVDQLTQPMPAKPRTLEDCIAASDLSDTSRGMLLDIVDTMRRYERGESEVTASNTRKRAKPRPSQ
jgi:transcriptional regulator with XRE-family HTH domain